MKRTEKSEDKQFPGVELAYPIAVGSYDVAIKRMDSIDGRLQTILAFVLTASVAFITFAKDKDFRFDSAWFVSGICFLVASIIVGISARLYGAVRLLRPMHLWQTWLTDDEWTFKKDLIHDAAIDFDANMRLANLKWKCSVMIMILFVLEALCLTVWVVVGPHGNYHLQAT